MSLRNKIPLKKLIEKQDLPTNDSLLSNHFSEQSFLETHHEALLKSFEIEYEIEDKTGDKILLMNFSRKKKNSIDNSINKTKNTKNYEEKTKKIPIKNTLNEKNEDFLVKTCPNLKNFNELFIRKIAGMEENNEEFAEYQSLYSKRNESFKSAEECLHIRNSSWENFNRLRKNHQNPAFMRKNVKKNSDDLCRNWEISEEKNEKNPKNNFFSFANNLCENEKNEKIVYLHVPGYLQDEIKEQEFTETVISKEANGLDNKKAILQELYSIKQKKNNNENKENVRFSHKNEKKILKNEKNEKKHGKNDKNEEKYGKNEKKHEEKPGKNESFFEKYQKKINFFEAARLENHHIEILSQKSKKKCL